MSRVRTNRQAEAEIEHLAGSARITIASCEKEIVRLKAAIAEAANMADQADLDDQNNNGAAASGAAHGLGDRIRALAVQQLGGQKP